MNNITMGISLSIAMQKTLMIFFFSDTYPRLHFHPQSFYISHRHSLMLIRLAVIGTER